MRLQAIPAAARLRVRKREPHPSSTAADEKALSSAGFKPSRKGLKFLLSTRESEVKVQESPTATEHVEHHHGM